MERILAYHVFMASPCGKIQFFLQREALLLMDNFSRRVLFFAVLRRELFGSTFREASNNSSKSTIYSTQNGQNIQTHPGRCTKGKKRVKKGRKRVDKRGGR